MLCYTDKENLLFLFFLLQPPTLLSKKAGRGKGKDMDYKDEEEERKAELLKNSV